MLFSLSVNYTLWNLFLCSDSKNLFPHNICLYCWFTWTGPTLDAKSIHFKFDHPFLSANTNEHVNKTFYFHNAWFDMFLFSIDFNWYTTTIFFFFLRLLCKKEAINNLRQEFEIQIRQLCATLKHKEHLLQISETDRL